MSAQHFSEIVDTICTTKRMTYVEIAKFLKVSIYTLRQWRKYGVTSTKVRTTGVRLKALM